MVKVEMLIQVCVNGRPVWRKAKTMKSELTYQMTDREYDRVLDSAVKELSTQVQTKRTADEAIAKSKEKVGSK